MRICPLCGAEMTTVAHSVCEVLDVIPARLIVIARKDETVACPKDNTIVSAPVPPAIVERGKLGDTLLVESLADKYLEHQPIERQCARYARGGAPIAPQTLARGVNAAIDLLAPVADLIEEQTRGPGLLGTDATGIPILDPAEPEGIRTGAMWAWTNARWVIVLLFAERRLRQRAALPRRRSRAHRAVRRHGHADVRREEGRQAPRLLESRPSRLRRGRALGRRLRARGRSPHRTHLSPSSARASSPATMPSRGSPGGEPLLGL